MDEKILELLKESGAAGWEVTDTVKEGWEFYFIRHELDQNRIVDTEHVTVCVYESIGDGKEVGSARMEIPAGSEESEVRDMIAQLRREASLVKNPYYELHHPGFHGGRSHHLRHPGDGRRHLSRDSHDAQYAFRNLRKR